MFGSRRKYTPTMDLSTLWDVFAEKLRDNLVKIGAAESLATELLATLREIYEKAAERAPVDLKCPAKCSAHLERIVEDLSDRNMRVCTALLLEIAARELKLLRCKEWSGG